MSIDKDLLIIGWREWVAFPELGISTVKAKVDSGARTSALHAFSIERFHANKQDRIRFKTHPVQYKHTPQISCEARLLDIRPVTSSSGDTEVRHVIETPIYIGGHSWPVELTLTNRSNMRFRMLLGRHAMKHRAILNPGRSYLTGTRQQLENALHSFQDQ
ncbi:MAG: ATP-dependent zinc protease [Thiolinea sp.]